MNCYTMNYTLYYIMSANDSPASLKYRGFKNIRTTISSLEATDQLQFESTGLCYIKSSLK